MTTPDPAFVRFFDVEFQRELDVTQIPGWEGASWDRKAAWLLWQARQRDPKPTPPPKAPGGIFD